MLQSKFSLFGCALSVCLFVTGSPAIHNEEVEDVDAHDDSENQNEKQKIAERMLSWHMTFGREETGGPKYDKEVSHNNIPLLTNGTDV